jgi:ribose/xylose/arabinose/galactoside ABC-type transport system permease subunit
MPTLLGNRRINMTDLTTAPPIEASSGVSIGKVLARLGPLIGLVFVFFLFTFLTRVLDGQKFATMANMELIFRQTAVVGIAALGMTMIIISGGIDLSVGSTLALSIVCIAWVLERTQSQYVIPAALMGIAAATLCGMLLGFLITVMRLSPFIASLGLWGAVRGLAKGLCELFQRFYSSESSANIQVLDDSWKATWLKKLILPLDDDQRWMLFPPGVWLMLFLAVLVAAILRYTRFGRHVFAVGSNEQTARLCGVNVAWTKFLIYTFAGMLVGIASVLEFATVALGEPTDRMGAELDVIAAVVIGGASLSGGQGSVFGTLIGALIMTMVANGCTKVGLSNWVQDIATGGIIILAVTVDRLRHRRGA